MLFRNAACAARRSACCRVKSMQEPTRSRSISWWPWGAREHSSGHPPQPVANTQPQDSPAGPIHPCRPLIRSAYGQQWADDYSWLESGASCAEVRAALQAEAAFYQHWQRKHVGLERRLRHEMLVALPEEQVSVPERVGAYEYFVRQTAERPHPCYLRRPAGSRLVVSSRPGSGEGAEHEEVVLDLNELAVVHGGGISLGQLKLSRCGSHVAFSLEEGTGEELYAGFIRELGTGATWQHPALGGLVSLEWAADGATLLFTTPNHLGRPSAVHMCQAGHAPAAASGWGNTVTTASAATTSSSSRSSSRHTIFQEADERFFLELGRTKDWQWLTINANSKTASEVHLLPAAQPWLQPQLVQPRSPGLEYFVESAGGQLYILSNAGQEEGSSSAQGYALFRVPATGPLGREHWVRVLPEQEGVCIEDMDVFQSAVVLYERHWGRQAVSLLPVKHGLPCPPSVPASTTAHSAAAAAATPDPPAASMTPFAAAPAAQLMRADEAECATTPQLVPLPLPDWAFSVAPGANADCDATTLRLTLSSPIHPDTPLDWDLSSGSQLQLQLASPPAAAAEAAAPAAGVGSQTQAVHRPQSYTCHQLWATAADGTRIPMTVAHSAGLALDGSAPCLLAVYGAYGQCLPTDFDPARLPLLARGWVLALAHVRGGGELGRQWHAAGRGALKPNSAADLEACLESLITSGYTGSGRVCLEAMSAGSLAAAGLINRCPTAIGAAVLEVPFLDLLTAMISPELPLTVHEYEEWGDPSDPQQFARLAALCPYTQLRQAEHPAVMLTCSQTDLRVPFWGVLKYAAKLRATQRAPSRPVLVLADEHEGHFAQESQRFHLKAQEYAFLISQLQAKGERS